MRLDDSLDVVGVHGVGGAWGALATGIFAVAAVGGADGLIEGNASQFGKQLVGVGATMGYSLVMTFVILKVLDLVLGLRVTKSEEEIGIDASQHGERAYVFDVGGPGFIGIPQTLESTIEIARPVSSPVSAVPASPSGRGS